MIIGRDVKGVFIEMSPDEHEITLGVLTFNHQRLDDEESKLTVQRLIDETSRPNVN